MAAVTPVAAAPLGDMNSAKVANIMSYLDDVDRASLPDRPRSPDAPSHVSYAASGARRSYAGSEVCTALSVTGRENVFHGIKAKLETLRQENAELKRQNERLRGCLAETADAHDSEKRALRDTVRRDAESQRESLQQSLDEHLRTIRKLVGEKEKLTRTTQELTSKLHGIEMIHEERVRKIEAAHAQAVSEVKGRLSQQEKAKREQWSVKEAKRIKEATLKAMEPDIALLMNRHKAEKRRIEEEHAEALRRKDDQILLKERELAEAKVRLGRDVEDLISRERSSLRGHVGDETRRMEREFNGEREILKSQHASEIREHEQQRSRLQARLAEQEQKLAVVVVESEARLREAQVQHEEALARLTREHRIEAQRVAEAHQRSLQEADAHVEERSAKAASQKLAAVEARMQSECDRAVDAAVCKLEAEQLRMAKEQRLRERELTEKIAAQVREISRLRDDLAGASERLATAKADAEHREETITNLRTDLQKVQTRLSGLREESDSEIGERLRALDSAWRAKTASLENDHVAALESHRTEVLKLQANADRERQSLAQKHDEAERRHTAELAAVTDRVTSTINRKDGQIRQLQEDVATLEHALQSREAEMARHTALLGDVNNDDRDGSQCLDDFE